MTTNANELFRHFHTQISENALSHGFYHLINTHAKNACVINVTKYHNMVPSALAYYNGNVVAERFGNNVTFNVVVFTPGTFNVLRKLGAGFGFEFTNVKGQPCLIYNEFTSNEDGTEVNVRKIQVPFNRTITVNNVFPALRSENERLTIVSDITRESTERLIQSVFNQAVTTERMHAFKAYKKRKLALLEAATAYVNGLN